MRDSQNSTHDNPSPASDVDSPSEISERKYYYDDSTGYEIYREEDESADEDDTLDLEDD